MLVSVPFGLDPHPKPCTGPHYSQRSIIYSQYSTHCISTSRVRARCDWTGFVDHLHDRVRPSPLDLPRETGIRHIRPGIRKTQIYHIPNFYYWFSFVSSLLDWICGSVDSIQRPFPRHRCILHSRYPYLPSLYSPKSTNAPLHSYSYLI